MGAITGRLVDCDVAIMTVGGEDVLAVYREASYELSVDEVDVTAAKDGWKQREQCVKDWRFTCTKLLAVNEVFATLLLAGGSVAVSTDVGGTTFYGVGLFMGVTVSTGNPQTEQITVVSAGGTPTLT
jgi:hypothetical protein